MRNDLPWYVSLPIFLFVVYLCYQAGLAANRKADEAHPFLNPACRPEIIEEDGNPPICAGTGEWVAWGPQVPERER